MVDLPKGQNAVKNKRIFKIKTDDDGSVERFKARLEAQGFSRKPDLNQLEQLFRWRCKTI